MSATEKFTFAGGTTSITPVATPRNAHTRSSAAAGVSRRSR
ncbi:MULTISPECIES: hypothetical protein [Catenuloplanes]|nr:hypothetical protein [Catenuloplanes niger]